MIALTDKQGTLAWKRSRYGLPTASCFDQIITPKTMKPSGSQDKYLATLIAEWFLQESVSDFQSGFMERGSALEIEAVAAYEFDTDRLTTEVGLCLTDDRRAGASPDRLVGDDMLLEVKSPGATTQVGYLLDGPPDTYRCQVQGELWVTGRAVADLYLWHPSLPCLTVPTERDEKFIAALSSEVAAFCDRLDAAKVKLADKRAEYLARKESDIPAGISP